MVPAFVVKLLITIGGAQVVALREKMVMIIMAPSQTQGERKQVVALQDMHPELPTPEAPVMLVVVEMAVAAVVFMAVRLVLLQV